MAVTNDEIELTGTVYGLVDPRDLEVRYIGGTIQTLRARLNGHLRYPSSEAAGQWVAELANLGLLPSIIPLLENVPSTRLLATENDEITRRILAGENLLNRAGTAKGFGILRERDQQAKDEALRAAWHEMAEGLRRILGGPPPPGPVEIELGQDTWEALQAGAEAEWPQRWTDELAQSAESLVWRDIRDAMPDLNETRAKDDPYVICCQAVDGIRWDSKEMAAEYINAIPWMLMVLAPWRALARCAGLPSVGDAFSHWVSDDARVHSAWKVLERRSGLMDRVTDDASRADRRVNALAALVTVGAAYGGLQPDPLLHRVITPVLQRFADHGQLTQPLADLMASIDANALDLAYGPDVAALIDSRTGLPRGTAEMVLAELAILRPCVDELAKILRRTNANLATTDQLPLFRGLSGPGLNHVRVMVAGLAQRGLLPTLSQEDREGVESIQLLCRVSPERHTDSRYRNYLLDH